MSSNEGIAAELREHLVKRQNPLDSLGWERRNALVLAAGFAAAQAAYDNATPDYIEEGGELPEDWCDDCGDQGVCPECVGT